MQGNLAPPAPSGPSKPNNSASTTAKLTPESAFTLPKWRTTSTKSTAAGMETSNGGKDATGGNGAPRERAAANSARQNLLDVVERGERLEPRRKPDEVEPPTLGRSAPLQCQQHRDGRRVECADAAAVDGSFARQLKR